MHPARWKGEKTTGVLKDSLRMYTMYILGMCMTWRFILKCSIARLLVEEKISPAISLMPLLEGRARGHRDLRRPKQTS